MNKIIRVLFILFIIGFVTLNFLAAFQAYRFTHYINPKDLSVNKTTSPFIAKWDKILFGVEYPKAISTTFPSQPYKTIVLKSNKKIVCWEIPADSAKGTVILYHGYTASKSDMLERSDYFHSLGYNTMLVDFMGAGGSEGDYTTIGYEEAEQVKTSFNYCATKTNPNKIILLGTSMGAVAIMKACNDYQLTPKSIIIECPFATMRQTIKNRFDQMKLPSFPFVDLLAFWGGAVNGFNAFTYNPVDYAKNIKIPTLLIYGKHDVKVIRKEIDDIFTNLKGKKELAIFPNAAHANYLATDNLLWKKDVKDWLAK